MQDGIRKPYVLSEREVTYQILDYLRIIRAVAWKNHGHLGEKPGRLDIDGCYQGRFIAIEVKGPKGKVSEAQAKQVELIRAAGGIAIVAYDLDDVIEIITRINEKEEERGMEIEKWTLDELCAYWGKLVEDALRIKG